MFKRTALLLAGLVMASLVFFGAQAAVAQTDTFGINPINSTIGLGSGDIREIAARFINIALGVLGLITVALILYGGFLYMTSGGSEDKIAEGKKYIINATIGLVIILSAWAIVLFVFKQLGDAIIGGNTNVLGDPDNNPGACEAENYNKEACDATCAAHPEYDICQDREFYVKAITPGSYAQGTETLTTGMKNVTVRVLLSRAVKADADVSKAVTIQRKDASGPLPVKISLVENNRVLEVNYLNNGTVAPFAVSVDNPYTVTVSTDLVDSLNQKLKAEYKSGGKTYANSVSFLVDKDRVDATLPFLTPITLNNKSGNGLTFAQNTSLVIAGTITDRVLFQFGGNGLVKISVAKSSGEAIFTTYAAPYAKDGSSVKFDYSYTTKLDNRFEVGQNYTVTVVGNDIDGNTRTVSTTFKVQSSHCDNNILDGNETGVDSGGSCAGGDGDQCEIDSDCATGFQCVGKVCTPAPVITGVDRMDGAVGNWITITGKSFGNTAGTVAFGVDANNNGDYDNNEWIPATIVNCGNGQSWRQFWIIVAVPDIAVDKKAVIKVTTSNNKFDTTINDLGGLPGGDGLFTVNTTKRPGLCSVGVTADTEVTLGGEKVVLREGEGAATPGVGVTVKGNGLGTANSASKITFGATKNITNNTLTGGVIAEIVENFWTELAVKVRVPTNFKPGYVAVHALVGGEISNGVQFQVLSPDVKISVPQITAIDPASTTVGSYITIKGSGFGSFPGFVYVASGPGAAATCGSKNPDSSCKQLSVTDFPNQCGSTWSASQVIAAIPGDEYFAVSAGQVKKLHVVVVTDTSQTSGQEFIEIVPGSPRPSICKISPNHGPSPLPNSSNGLIIYGANFYAQTKVHFWRKNSDPLQLSTWLSAEKKNGYGNDNTAGAIVTELSKNHLVTRLPVATDGTSMSSGPIKVTGPTPDLVSNGVNYTVDSCIGSKTALPGYHCCDKGAEAGTWKPNSLACAGEPREAGYLWRFTTGIIANAPSVVEECNANSFPSPTPRVKGTPLVNSSACVNSTVAVRFTTDIQPGTLTANSVKLFACGTNASGQIDCAAKKEPQSLTLEYQNSGKTLIIRQEPPALTASTWYQVELATTIKSIKLTNVLGKEIEVTAPLLATRPCGTGTAYCFSFRTDSTQCTLVDAGINPPEYTARQIGIIQDPNFPFDSTDLFLPTQNPPELLPDRPVYYYLWGKGNQDCSVINVDKYPWAWSPTLTGAGSEFATAHKAVKQASDTSLPYLNSRAVVAARSQTNPSVTIKAEATINNALSNYAEITGLNVLSAANIVVPSNGYTPKQRIELPSSLTGPLSLQSSFTVRLKFSQSDPFPYNTLVSNLVPNNSTAGGYRFTFVGGQMCFKTFVPPSGSLGKQLCFYPTATSEGIYDVALYWDKNTSKLTWVNLTTPVSEVSANDFFIPNPNKPVSLVYETQPANSNGPTFYEFIYRNDLPEFTVQGEKFQGTVKFAPTSTLYVELADPVVTYYEPNCAESCVNASIRADFNRQMDPSTYAAGLKVFLCDSQFCENPTDVTSEFAVDQAGSNLLSLRVQRTESAGNLKPNTFYKVSLNGAGTGEPIKALLRQDPVVRGKALKPFEWIFKTKNDGKPCSVGTLSVVPISALAKEIGEQHTFTVVPYSVPNVCSKIGQALNKWAYSYTWSVDNSSVAKITNLKSATYSNIPNYCTNACVKKGSTFAAGSVSASGPLCGNGIKDLGEDCDIAMAGEVVGTNGVSGTCTLSCVRPGNPKAFSTTNTGANVCGNGQVEAKAGEQCDPGNQNNAVKTDNPYCTSTCVFRGSKQVTAGAVGTCGDGIVTPDRESCDREDPATKAGCTEQCLLTGSPTASYWCQQNKAQYGTTLNCLNSVSVCGNGKLEPNEDCEAGTGAGQVPAANCSDKCLFINACDLPENIKPCQAGTPGCSAKCTLLGSKTSYSTPSVCGDGTQGTGENPLCELPVNIGANSGPTQIVEAVGEGALVANTDYQQTTVKASLTVENKVVSSTADYRLQCGYSELNEFYIEKKYIPIPGTNFSKWQDVPVYNDCPNNNDNSLGVDAQSCCLARPKRETAYPEDGAGFGQTEGVCRNTFVEVGFNQEIRSDSVKGNVFFVRGFGQTNFDCQTVGGYNVTPLVNESVSAFAQQQKPGFWARLWQSILMWVRNLFGTETIATSVKNSAEFTSLKTWCTVPIATDVKTRVVTEQGKNKTIASISISEPLEPTAVYGVLLVGDNTILNKFVVPNTTPFTDTYGITQLGGIVNTRGVPLKAFDTANRNDVWFFKTAPDICKIDSVKVSPDSYLFQAPATSTIFQAVAATKKNQYIVPTLGYRWTWSWVPANNPVFTFEPQTSGAATDPAERLKVTSKNAPGKITAIAQAKVTEDSSLEKNQKDLVFSDTFDLTAFYCENPWPEVGQYPYKDNQFNFSTGYCADAGKPGDKTDDLPVLKGSLSSLNSIAGATDVLKKGVFFNPKNDDVIGVQIFESSGVLQEWYTKKFGSLGSMKLASVGGYPTLTDGNNYYVQALNLTGGETAAIDDDRVFNNVYLFSINPNAAADTRQVFEKMLAALEFNTNVTDHGYCLASGNGVTPAGNIRTNPNYLSTVTVSSCQTDFDCRTAEGLELPGTNGTCSNARTKFQRDWKRVSDVSTAQDLLDGYFAQNKNNFDFKGAFASGSFAPGYTVSRWAQSWGALQTMVGAGLANDPLNRWTSCDAEDKETCWSASSTTYYCPRFASVYEYEYVSSTKSYKFHAPFEYFTTKDDIVQKQINLERFSPERWCVGVAYNPFKSQCGDGIINTGEQCEPPGTVEQVNKTVSTVVNKQCANWGTPRDCSGDGARSCGYYNNKPLSIKNEPSLRLHSLVPGKFCGNVSGTTTDIPSVLVGQATSKEFAVFSCQTDADCVTPETYDQWSGTARINFLNYSESAGTVTWDLDSNDFIPLRDFKKSITELTTAEKSAVKCLTNTRLSSGVSEADSCVSTPAGEIACSSGQTATRTCTAQCNWSYGSCGAIGKCGNGVVEGAEACDDGALNGTYGHCNAPSESSLGCTGLAAAGYCGNGKKDFLDTDNDGVRDANEKEYEFCEPGVGGFVANYSLDRVNSCSWDCQNYGGYCGDGIVHTNEGEACDDGNKNDSDQCMNTCQLPALSCVQNIGVANTGYSDTTKTTRFTVLSYKGDVYNGGESCSVATPRSICAAAGLTCKEISGVQVVTTPSAVVTKACDATISTPGGTKVIGEVSVASLKNSLLPNADTFSVYCNGKYTPGGTTETESAAAPGMCGNGVKNPGEACDAGTDNGKKCTPQAGEATCTYCDGACKIQTVDNQIYCGNGKIDTGEQCEIDSNGGVIFVPTQQYCDQREIDCNAVCTFGDLNCTNSCTNDKQKCLADQTAKVTRAAQCSGVGTISCGNSCTLLDTSNCVACQAKPLGTVAKMEVLHTLVPAPASLSATEKTQLNSSFSASLYSQRKSLYATNVTLKKEVGSFEYQSGVYRDYDDIAVQNFKLEANNQCTNQYQVWFNAVRQVVGNHKEFNAATTFKGEKFGYAVSPSAEITNNFVVSPPVPKNVFRVVLRWTNSTEAYNGGVFNTDYAFSQHGTLYTEADAITYVEEWNKPNRGNFCNTMSKKSQSGINYWWPVSNNGTTFSCLGKADVYIAQNQTTAAKTVTVQTFTIDARKYTGPITFFVKALNNTIYENRNSDLEVRVYDYHEGQDAEDSVYGPRYKFEIKGAANTISTAEGSIWQPFNLVKNASGDYVVEKIPQLDVTGTPTGSSYDDGKIHTKFCKLKKHLPGDIYGSCI